MRRFPRAELTKKLSAVLRRYPVQFAYVYGSVARGDQLHRESDIDLAVALDPTLRGKHRFLLHVELVGAIHRALGLPAADERNVDVKIFDELPLPLAFRVFQEGYPVYVRNSREHTMTFLKTTAQYHDEQPIYRQERERRFSRLSARR